MMKDVAKAFAGGAVLYVVMAACSASDGGSGWVKNGASGGGFGGAGGSLFDALTDPVPNAEAGEPQVAQEPCDKTTTYQTQTFYYAEHLYPGKTKTELLMVRAFADFTPGGTNLAGYVDAVSAQQYLADGKVAVYCGFEAGHTATFVLP
jgi:hypothetical protein